MFYVIGHEKPFGISIVKADSFSNSLLEFHRHHPKSEFPDLEVKYVDELSKTFEEMGGTVLCII